MSSVANAGPTIRVTALHALASCERLFYLESVPKPSLSVLGFLADSVRCEPPQSPLSGGRRNGANPLSPPYQGEVETGLRRAANTWP